MLTCKAKAGRARKSERLKTGTKNTKITAMKFGRAEPFYVKVAPSTLFIFHLTWRLQYPEYYFHNNKSNAINDSIERGKNKLVQTRHCFLKWLPHHYTKTRLIGRHSYWSMLLGSRTLLASSCQTLGSRGSPSSQPRSVREHDRLLCCGRRKKGESLYLKAKYIDARTAMF